MFRVSAELRGHAQKLEEARAGAGTALCLRWPCRPPGRGTKRVLPRAKHQSCWVHLMRAVSRLVRPSDRKDVLDALKRVCRQENATLARQELSAFLNSYGTKYKRLHKLFQNEASLFSFYEFPKSIQQTIYTSNLIENNKGFRRKSKLKEQFPNEDSLERFACMVYCDYNRRFSGKAHRGF